MITFTKTFYARVTNIKGRQEIATIDCNICAKGHKLIYETDPFHIGAF